MAKSILSLIIGFGAVSVPIRIYKAVENTSPSFHQYHKDDKGPVRHQKVCSVDKEVLELHDISKGKRFGSEIILFAPKTTLLQLGGFGFSSKTVTSDKVGFAVTSTDSFVLILSPSRETTAPIATSTIPPMRKIISKPVIS